MSWNFFYLRLLASLETAKKANERLKDVLRHFRDEYILKYLKPERSFAFELEMNPFHPFKQTNSFEYEFTYQRSYIKCFLYLIFLIWAMRYSFIEGAQVFEITVLEAIPIAVTKVLLKFVILVCIFFNSIRKPLLDAYFERKLVIKHLENCYSFYLDDRLAACSSLENLYLRIDEKHVIRNKVIYSLVVYGRGVEPIETNSETSDLDRIRKVGRQLAYNLGVNFFDVDDKSLHHEIIFKKSL
jgi:uncharacterized protein YerC